MNTHNISLVSLHSQRPFMADARYKSDGNPKPVVIFNHGFKGFKDWGPFPLVADAFAQAGFVFIKVNFSHNGVTRKTQQNLLIWRLFPKTISASNSMIRRFCLTRCSMTHRVLTKKDMDLSRLYIAGHSRGGASAILKAAEDSRIKKVATWAAVSNLETWHSKAELDYWRTNRLIYVLNKRTNQQMPLDFQLVENYQENRSRLHVPDAVKKLQIPMLAIHGSADETVPVAAAHSFKEWNPSVKVKIIDNANHTFGADHPFIGSKLPNDFQLVVDETVRFFCESK
ncbi:MAG: prolyl oligopeptidase family serine peptidase [Cyclobacteriaceae bacterium]|nr:prolyl oligopeptidase family serine peptidase [Cyclobacteriaceae bacterium]